MNKKPVYALSDEVWRRKAAVVKTVRLYHQPHQADNRTTKLDDYIVHRGEVVSPTD